MRSWKTPWLALGLDRTHLTTWGFTQRLGGRGTRRDSEEARDCEGYSLSGSGCPRYFQLQGHSGKSNRTKRSSYRERTAKARSLLRIVRRRSPSAQEQNKKSQAREVSPSFSSSVHTKQPPLADSKGGVHSASLKEHLTPLSYRPFSSALFGRRHLLPRLLAHSSASIWVVSLLGPISHSRFAFESKITPEL